MPGEDFDYEKEALSLGWLPQDKWTGDPEKWADAKSFVERGERTIPFLIKDKRELAERVRKQQEEIDRLTKDGVDFRKMMEAQRDREKAERTARIAELEEARAQAITDGDGKAAVAAEKEIQAAETAAAKLEKETKREEKQEAKLHPEFVEWQKENSWYGEDEDLTIMANGYYLAMKQKNPNKDGKEVYEAVKAKVAKSALWAEKFPDEKRPINTVETNDDTRSMDTTIHSTTKKGYDNLPPEAKRACDDYIKRGWISDRDGKTVAEKRASYARTYFESEK